MGVCNCSMFCCALLYVHFSIAIILMGKRELIALLNLSSWCLVMVERLFLTVPLGCLQFVIVVFPHHTHLLLFMVKIKKCHRVQSVCLEACICCSPGSAPAPVAYRLVTTSEYSKSFFRIASIFAKLSPIQQKL